MSAKNGKAKSESKAKVNVEDRRLQVLKAMSKLGATSAEKAVAADTVIGKFKDFPAGNLLYTMRHESPALVATTKIDGMKKPRYLTAAGKKLVADSK